MIRPFRIPVLLSGFVISLLSASALATADKAPTLIQHDPDRMAPQSQALPANTENRIPVSVDIQALQKEQRFSIEGEFGYQWSLETTAIEGKDSHQKAWRGTVTDGQRHTSTATFSIQGERIHGRFNTSHGAYRLWGNADSGYWMDRINLDAQPEPHPPQKLEDPWPEAEGDSPSQAGSDEDEAVVLDILAFYTEASIEEYPDEASLRLAIQNTIDMANTALEISEIDHRFRYLGALKWSGEESNNMGETLGRFADDGSVASLRDIFSADLVTSFGVYDDFCGMAYLMSQYSSSWEGGYSTNNTAQDYPCFDIQVVAHELGHNLGLHHDPDNAGSPGNAIEPFAFGHVIVDEFSSVMAYHPGCGGGEYHNCIPADFFSNPNVADEDSGHTTGVPDERDNAEVLRRTMPYAQHWRSQPGDINDLLDDLSGELSSEGHFPWRMQDQTKYQGEASLISAPVMEEEVSRLTLNLEDKIDELTFYARLSDENLGDGTLRILVDGESVQELDAFQSSWEFIEVALPEASQTVEVEWRGNSSSSSDQGPNSILLADIGGQEDDSDDDSEEGGDGGGSSSGGCSLSHAKPDPLLGLMAAMAFFLLLRTRRS